MRLRTLLLVSTTLLLAVTCDKKKEEPEPQPPVTPKIEIPSESQAVFSQGISIQAGTQTQSLTVKFTATAAWSADVADTKSSSWLSVQPTSGSAGAVTMTVTAQPNTTDKARSSTVTIQCGTVKQSFTVNQDAAVPQTVAVESVTLNKTELTLEPSGTETLTATVAPENATDKTVTWSTSNAEIATVADGKVTAVKEGEAIITAKAGEKQATCKVTVKKGVVAVTSVTLNKDKLDLRKGEDETLVATVAPDDATDKTVTWSSSDATIASVDETGKVTAVKSGKATITAAAGEKSAMCSVTVTTPVQSVSLDRTSVTLEVGQMTTLFATVSPNDADEKTVTWASSNVAVASIAGGVVTAMSEGTAVIKASAGGKEASCTVTVQKNVIAVTSVTLNKTTLSLTKGQSETLTATVAPDDATDKTVTWTSSDTKVVTVENGTVKAVGDGTAVITAKAGEQSATCEVSVIIPVESVSLDVTSMTLKVGQKSSVLVKIQPLDATILEKAWSNTHPEVATVDMMDNIEAISVGQTVITVTIDGKSASCTITVEEQSVSVESVTLNKNILSLTKGQSETLSATVAPDNATDKTVTWSSSDAAIASVDQTGKVTAVKEGEATITAKAGEKEATCKVVVSAEDVPFSISPTNVEIAAGGGTFDVTVTCSTSYHLNSKPDWVTEKAVNGKVHTFEVSANTSTEQRSGVIVFCDDEGTCVPCNIKQSGVEASFSLSPTSVEIESSGGTFNVTVTCSTNYHLDSKPDWVTEKSVEGKVHTFEVSANTSTAQRSGVIVFCDDMGTCLPCNIRQAGTASISLSVDKPSLSFSFSSGSNLLSITSNTEWSVVPSQSWCHSSYTSGSGNAQITISVDPNDSENARSEVLTICSADNTVAVYVSIMQEGKPASTDFDWTKNFYHQSLFMRFTATWCGWCPRMNKSVHDAQERYPNKIIHLAIHGRGSALEFSKIDLLAYQYQISGFPAGIVDGRDRIYNEEVNVVVPKIIYDVQETEKTFGTKTGLSIESSVAGRSVEINIGAYIKKAGSYKVSVFLVEDGIVSSQTDYEEGDKPNYVHDGVARIAVSDARGDDFSVVSDYSLKKFSYTVNVPSEYKLENMRVLAYIQASYSSDYTGVLYYGNYYVDNCATSQLGKTLAVQVDDRVSGGGNEGIDIGDIITF